MKTLETNRLILREWKMTDVYDMFEYASMDDVGIAAGWPKHDSLEISQTIVESFVNEHNEYAIVLKESNKVIGSIGIKNSSMDKLGNVDQRCLGYVLNKNYWGLGIMPEAVKRVIAYLFDDVGVEAIWLGHFTHNTQSKSVILKCGFEVIGEGKYDAKLLNITFDTIQYAMTKDKYIGNKGIKKEFPILEFDEDKDAFINPSILVNEYKPFCQRFVICFFHEVVDKMLEDGELEVYETINGENPVYVYKFKNEDCLISKGYVGGAGCAGIIEEAIGLGSTIITFCGGAGSLHPDITVGKLVVVDSAIRDDGVSYHYMKPSREVTANKEVVKFTENYLNKRGIDFVTGKVWTTDAFFRETKGKITLRNNEGCLMVEMEQAGMLAISSFRDVHYSAILYGGDDLTSEKWDQRDWKNRYEIRKELIVLCKDLSKAMEQHFEE